MNQYNEIPTLQYMGSKTRIISHICEPIIKNKSIKTVVDLFAGTGSIGYSLKQTGLLTITVSWFCTLDHNSGIGLAILTN